jgi:MurNAc alpha-1-phosphate uridylyltransferase
LETGGGIRRALSQLGSEPFLLINADIWTDFPLETLVNKSWSEEVEAHLVLVPNPVHHRDGDFTLNTHKIVGYPGSGGSTFTFSGLSIMRPESFAMHSSASEKFPMRDVLVGGIRAGYVQGEVFHGTWWDVGTLERLEALNALMSGDKRGAR